MTAWERVGQLFQEAVEQPADRRDAFVARVCNGDDELKREVMSLLAAHAAADGFLETPITRIDDGQSVEAGVALQPGERIGDFEVRSLLGAGGMGEVYRAHDSRLGRDVALKLLPPSFAGDPERVARFERESRVLASLNHRNIAAIHSIERIADRRLLVLELVEGPTLADRLSSGSMPVAEALDVARQLAEALEAAHERGVVHRDLKPANVKLTASRRVMLLDFGLATEHGLVGEASVVASGSGPHTNAGVILGTCAYMSPEQARGQRVDKRTDIWAFGCILFELLTGRRAFDGETSSDAIAAVLQREPDWSPLPDTLPSRVRDLIRRCLEKDPRRRLHDIADARIEIEDALQAPEGTASSRPRQVGTATLLGIAVVTIGAAALGWWVRGSASGSDAVPAPASRFTWSLPSGMQMTSPAVVSPDGALIAFTAVSDGTAPRLYIRPMNAVEARPVPRTEGAAQPFWAPDSSGVAYFARGKLMRVLVEGGAPVEIADAPNARGGSWGRSGMIVFSSEAIFKGLSRVSADGGLVEPVTLLDAGRGENSHRWPAFLPDGIHFLYFVRSIVDERRGVYLGRVDRPATMPGTPLFRSEAEALYAPLNDDQGVLMNVADGHIEVRRFNARRRIVTGDPVTIPLPAGGNTPHQASGLSLAAGVLIHLASPLPYGQRLASSTIPGRRQLLDVNRNIVNWPRISPDGTRIVSQRVDALTGSPDLWVQNLARGSGLRVTPPNTSGQLPVWSPDGRRLAYVAGPQQKPVLTIAAADGTGVISTVICPRFRCEPSDWSPDGKWLLVTALDDTNQADVWMLPTGAGAARPLVMTPFDEHDARFSRDGGSIAYVSRETRRPEILILTIEGSRQREVVSLAGGTQPVWSRDGKALFFVDPDGALRSATVRRSSDGRPIVGAATRLDVPLIGAGHFATQYDVSPDGRRLYYIDQEPAESPRDVGIVLGWRALLEATNPTSAGR